MLSGKLNDREKRDLIYRRTSLRMLLEHGSRKDEFESLSNISTDTYHVEDSEVCEPAVEENRSRKTCKDMSTEVIGQELFLNTLIAW